MKCLQLIPAESIIIDRITSRLSAINYLDVINAYNYPVLTPLNIFLTLYKEDFDSGNQHTVTIHLIFKDQPIKSPIEIPIEFGEDGISRGVYNAGSIVVPEPGFVHIIVTHSKTQLHTSFIQYLKVI